MAQNEIVRAASLPINEMLTMAKAFAESGMFADTRQAAQALVKIQAGQELGIQPFAAMTGIHIIAGKPVVGAGIIASRIKASGKYDYEVEQHTDQICSINFMQGKKLLGNSTFTIEEARKAGTKNLDKFPKNMLFARAMSNGVRWHCPDVFNGPVYVPEEMDGAKTEDIPHEEEKEPANGAPAATATLILPAINDGRLNNLLNRIGGGELDVIKSAKATFSFTDAQEKDLIDAMLLGFTKRVNGCGTKKDLTALYEQFKGEVDGNADMQHIMKERQAELKAGAAQLAGEDKSSDWKMVVEACTTIQQLTTLYNKNKKVIDADPALMQLLADRRNTINGKGAKQPAGA